MCVGRECVCVCVCVGVGSVCVCVGRDEREGWVGRDERCRACHTDLFFTKRCSGSTEKTIRVYNVCDREATREGERLNLTERAIDRDRQR